MTKARSIGSGLLAWSGMIGAPLAWAVATEFGQILPYHDCYATLRGSTLASAACLIAALAASAISWRAFRDNPGASSDATYRFAAMVSALGAIMFGFALAMQVVATMVLTGCER